MSTRTTTPEGALVKDCLRLLGWSNVVAKSWRNNTGAAAYKDDRGKKRFVKFGERGVSDILGVLAGSGRFLAVEAKAGKNGTTPEQREFLEAVDRAGGVALVVRDVAELQAALTHLAADPAWKPKRGEG